MHPDKACLNVGTKFPLLCYHRPELTATTTRSCSSAVSCAILGLLAPPSQTRHPPVTMASANGVSEAVEEVGPALLFADDAALSADTQQQTRSVNNTLPPKRSCLQVELELHGVLYTVSVLVHGEELLVVRIEDRDSLDTWHGEFAAKCEQSKQQQRGHCTSGAWLTGRSYRLNAHVPAAMAAACCCH